MPFHFSLFVFLRKKIQKNHSQHIILLNKKRKALLVLIEKCFSEMLNMENLKEKRLVLVFVGFFVFLEEFLLNVTRNELVASELHRE